GSVPGGTQITAPWMGGMRLPMVGAARRTRQRCGARGPCHYHAAAMRRPPSPAQVELAITLVALVAGVAALVQAVIALALRPHPVHPAWAPGAAAGALAVASLASLLVGRLRFGPALQR